MSMAPGPPPAQQQPPTIVIPGTGWVDVASRAITTVGFPVVVAGALLWFLLTRFQDTMVQITTRMNANTEAAGKLVQTATAEFEEIQRQSDELARQSGELGKQTVLLQQLVDDGKKITDLRVRELDTLQGIAKRWEGRP
jgi:hypothetical protein